MTTLTTGQQLKLQRRFAAAEAELSILRDELIKLDRTVAADIVTAAHTCITTVAQANRHNDYTLSSQRRNKS